MLAAAMQNGNTAAHCISINRPCSSLPNHTICCDRSDVCFKAGDVRTDAASLSLLLFPPPRGASSSAPEPAAAAVTEERIRPYTRKWDAYITKTIHEVRLRRVARPEEAAAHRCDVRHDASGTTSGTTFHNRVDAYMWCYKY